MIIESFAFQQVFCCHSNWTYCSQILQQAWFIAALAALFGNAVQYFIAILDTFSTGTWGKETLCACSIKENRLEPLSYPSVMLSKQNESRNSLQNQSVSLIVLCFMMVLVSLLNCCVIFKNVHVCFGGINDLLLWMT